jgi:hypothetical protein
MEPEDILSDDDVFAIARKISAGTATDEEIQAAEDQIEQHKQQGPSGS